MMDLSKDSVFKSNLSDQRNNPSRSLYCLIHNPRLFDESIKYKQLVSVTNFHTRTGLKKLASDEVKKKAKDLELELIAFLLIQRIDLKLLTFMIKESLI